MFTTDFRKGFRRALCLLTVLHTALMVGAIGSAPALAQDGARAAAPIPRESLMALARQFVDRVGAGMERADAAQGNPDSRTSAQIADGTEFILQARVDKHTLQGDMIAIKQANGLNVSLRDFFAVLGFPIRIDAAAGRAEGWFIRESRRFALDARAGRVESAGKSFAVDPAALQAQEDDDWLVPLDLLGQWFDMTFKTDLERQTLTVESAVPLPLQERDARHARRLPGDQQIPPPRLPRRDPAFLVADAPFLDLSATAAQRRTNADSESVQSLAYSAMATGDLARMNARTHLSGNLRDGPTSVRATLERYTEDPDLLGPLRARQVAIGDVRTVDLPLLDMVSQEQGVAITNRRKGQAVTFATTQIDGESHPDWDVELYRGDQLVGFQTVDESGRYVFPDIKLLSGANDFRLVFYGPSGEIVEEKRSVPVDLKALGTGEGFYDVALTRTDTIAYQKYPPHQEQTGAPRFGARYERAVGDSVVASAGVALDQDSGEPKAYAVAGLSTLVAGTFVNANTAYDLDGESAAELITRRNLGKHRIGARAQVNTDGFAPDSDEGDPPVLTVAGDVSGPLFQWPDHRVGYALESEYNARAGGAQSQLHALNLNAASGPWRLNNTVSYERTQGGEADDEVEILDHFNAMALTGRDRYRAAATYEIEPEPGMQSVLASWARRYSQTLNSEIEIEHFLKDPLTEIDARLNWTHRNVSVGPRVQYDTDGKAVASLNLRTALARNPQTGAVSFSGRPVAAYGGVAAQVFIDNDGDGAFGAGDEPAQGVRVEALQARRSAKTDAQGFAFLTDIPEARATDIVLDAASFPDPYLVQGREGLSTLPRPGRVAEAVFPLHRSGEIDGTLIVARAGNGGGENPAAGVRLYLYDAAGRKAAFTRTAYDGFYLFSLIPPGRYTLMADEGDLRLLGAESPAPVAVTIGYDGTVVSGVDFRLPGSENPVTIAVAPDDFAAFLRGAAAAQGAMGPKAGSPGRGVYLRLGPYKSRLMTALVWYRLKTRYPALVAGNAPVQRPAQAAPGEDGAYRLRLRPADDQDLEGLRRRCRAIAARGIGCAIEILPESLARESPAGARSPT